MAIVVPGRSYTTVVAGAPPLTAYGMLGPFFEGTVLAEVYVHCIAQAVGNWAFVASLGGSAEASEAAIRAGNSIIERSTGTLYGQPMLYWQPGAAGAWRFRIPVGVRVHSGSRYLVFALTCGGDGAGATAMVSARVMDIVGEVKGPGSR